jgi:non-heme chloroperoxidase
MPTVKTHDGVEIFYKDWGSGQPIVFSHGWPLSADDWDAQMMFFLAQGFRVIAHDRRGHGRSEQVGGGHDMDHYADDLAALTEHLDLQNAVHVGHSAGGGEVARYVGRHGEGRVAKVVLISSVAPYVMAGEGRPDGLPKSVFDDFRAQVAGHRSEFYRGVAEGPFYGFNRPDAQPSEPVIGNWWRQAMAGGALAQHDEITAFCEDFTEDLRKVSVPALVMQGEDDQVVDPATAHRAVALLKNGTIRTYAGYPHGMPVTHADVLNSDLLDFIRN